MKKRPVSVAIAVVERSGATGREFLIGQRPEGAPLAGMWEFPGGKLEPGEPPEEAAARECLEETGITVSVRWLLEEVEHDYEHATVRLHFFLCEPLDPAAEPLAPYRWASRDELATLEFPPANQSVLARLTITDHG